MSGRQGGADAASDYDVMSAEPMGGDDDDGHEWDANEMARGPGEDESEPLDDDQDDVGEDIEEVIGDEESDEPELEADEEGQDDEDDEEEDDEEELEAIDPPANWPEDFRDAFSELPPIAQHFVMNTARNMQADYTRKTQAIAQERQQMAQVRQAYSEFDRVLAPRLQQWAIDGMNPAQAVAQVLALSDFARNNPADFIKYLANYRGVDLQQLVQAQGEEYVDPQVAALRQPLAQVQAQLNQLTQQYTQGQQQQVQQQRAAAVNWTRNEIDQFARQADQNGNPLYPFFDDVVDDMTALISAGRAQSMPDAYRQAVWLNENTRARMLARSRSDENAKARRRAEQARRAASSLTGASGANGAFTGGDMSLRDTIHAAWQGDL